MSQLDNYDYYVFAGGRGVGKSNPTITQTLKWLLGGTVTYTFDKSTNTHLYHIKNDDIGEYVWSVSNEAFVYEPLLTRLHRMCEEYYGYMRYKYRDYERENEKDENN